MTHFDSPWKEALDRFLPLFLQFFFPKAYDDIDWNRGYDALAKELAQIVRDAKTGGRLADKLFRVWRKNGREAWVLIHIEIQAQPEDTAIFTLRINTYNSRIFDRYQRPVATFVVLADDRPDWKPCEFSYTIWGTKSLLRFPIVKLLEYADRQTELEEHDNPFALVVLAHLQSQATKDDGEKRRAWKVRLVKNLLDRGLTTEDIRQFFRIIDWLLELPEDLAHGFWEDIDQYEKEKAMPVFTSTEKYLMNKGKREAYLEIIDDCLKLKFGKEGADLLPSVQEIWDWKKLRSLHKGLGAADSIAKVRKMIARRKK